MENLKKNYIFEADIDGYSSEGYGVCRANGRAVFVPRAMVGERWRIRIVKVTSSAVYGRGEELISPSEHRIIPECPYFLKCGGCGLWHMSYEHELQFKLQKVNNALKHIGKQQVCAKEILAADSVYSYRNKGIYAVSELENQPCYGFYRERSHELIPIERCLIQHELSDRAAAAVRDFMQKSRIPAYDERTHCGVVRHVFCRQAVHTSDSVACVVVCEGLGNKTHELVAELRSACPELTGIVLNVNRNLGNTVLAGEFYTLWGKGDICDTLCGHKFTISPQAFFQINPPQAEKLYGRALEYALPERSGLVFELYCGAGTISLCLAEHADKVIAAEIVLEAVENARENAAANNIRNVEFICADAGQAAEALAQRGLKPDVVVVDPPRKGMSEQAIDAVSRMAPDRIVYVSCNPATLARDILYFNDYSYIASDVTAVDMFPRTAHVETVVLLSKGEIDSKKIRVEFSMEGMDMSGFQKDATYGQIKERVLEQTGLKVSSLYIAQVKQKHGIIERENYNKPKSENTRQPQCPPEKEKAITEALKFFGMI